jgi:hypothetical protein
MLKGSCLCGGVKYEAKGPLMAMVRCHCDQCRKASGAEFTTNGTVFKDGFKVLTGQELLARFESSAGNFRVFCSGCGSPLFKEVKSHPDQIRLRLGCLDSELEQKPLCHVFVSEKPAWSEITDELPQYAKFPDTPSPTR